MRPGNVLEIRLEVDILPCERGQSKIHIRLRERGVDHQKRVHGRCARDVDTSEEGLKGIITTDVVWNGVGDSDIFETTGGDLEVVP